MRFPKEQENFLFASGLLKQIKTDTNNLDVILQMQKFLIRQIRRVETKTRLMKKAKSRLKSLKANIGRNTALSRSEKKQKSSAIKLLISQAEARLKDYKQLLFLWRCFGDAVVGAYQSTYSLKHLFYDGDYNPKESAGFMTGKEGFSHEYRMLVTAIKKGVPAILCDLTNIIRHGDLCLMGAADPFLIEMKSSKNKNARTNRQLQQLQALSEFFTNDGADNFRGAGFTRRVELASEEVNYYNEINHCLSSSLEDGLCSVQPEKGLEYFSCSTDFLKTHGDDLLGYLQEVTRETTMIVIITPTENWLPMRSFVLSLSADNTLSFIQEDLHIAVLIDIKEIKKQISEYGYHVLVIMDGTSSFQLMVDTEDLSKGVCRVSEQLFLRVACEFQSLSWFAFECVQSMKSLLTDETLISWQQEQRDLKRFKEWENSKDYFERE